MFGAEVVGHDATLWRTSVTTAASRGGTPPPRSRVAQPRAMWTMATSVLDIAAVLRRSQRSLFSTVPDQRRQEAQGLGVVVEVEMLALTHGGGSPCQWRLGDGAEGCERDRGGRGPGPRPRG